MERRRDVSAFQIIYEQLFLPSAVGRGNFIKKIATLKAGVAISDFYVHFYVVVAPTYIRGIGIKSFFFFTNLICVIKFTCVYVLCHVYIRYIGQTR